MKNNIQTLISGKSAMSSLLAMKTNLQFFAKDRTNMVSLLDIGLLTGTSGRKKFQTNAQA